MEIIKRDKTREVVKLDKILNRVKKQCYGLDMNFIEPMEIAKKVISGLYDGISSVELDTLAAETAAALAPLHPDYSILAARICVTSLHKTTPKSFSENIEILYSNRSTKTKEAAPLISESLYKTVMANAKEIDSQIIHDRDLDYDYFGFKTLEKAYLLKVDGVAFERPQYMIMRVALGIHGDDLESAFKTYELMSKGFFTHATPTLFNAGTPRPQLSSCFLVPMEDSITGIYKTLGDCAEISKNSGGIGINIHAIRASGAHIKGTNGVSNGIIPMLKVFNETARYVNQGGKRNGSIAVYLEPWHADVEDFLDLRKNTGKEEARARDLFLALWVPDLFMKRIKADGDWTLFSPDEAPGLHLVYGEEFEALYEKYEAEGRGRKTMKAQELWYKVVEAQIETGNPYILYKDHINHKNNQKNLGSLLQSNLCSEVLEFTKPTNTKTGELGETAVCNLASISLPKFVTIKGKKKSYDFSKLEEIAYVATINLNRVIDVNFYPTPETKNSNMKHRPIGLGIQGLADVLAMMGIPFDTEEAVTFSKEIQETIYWGALKASLDVAKREGHYESFRGSPLSEGVFQFEMWGMAPSQRYDWEGLRGEIVEHGVRNSLLIANMPTASTSQILSNNECFEWFTSNIYTRRTISGEFPLVNRHLVKDLIALGLWNEEMRDKIILENGSVQNIAEIPQNLKDLYKTVWEIKQRWVIDHAAARAPFICQTQSMNLFFEDANFAKLTSAQFYAWEKGLKTGVYYTRTKASRTAIKGLGIDLSKHVKPIEEKTQEENLSDLVCSIDNPDDCLACGS